MAEISPFNAIRYDLDKVKDASKVIAPPYDVISSELQDALYNRHENNVVRIDFNRPESGDEPLSRYARAQKFFSEWLDQGILARDDQPGVYVLSQTFIGPDGLERTRTGFFCRVRLTPFADGPVLPHERTLKGPKQDRLELFRATKANLSPIFSAYEDKSGGVGGILAQACAGNPTVEAEMDDVKNQLWRVTDRDALTKLISQFADKKIYIADGHHRYETALAYQAERNANGAAGGSGHDHVLMFLAAVEDPGMVIFPTHRVVHGLSSFDEAKLIEGLGRYFEISDAPADATAAQAALSAAGEKTHALLMVTKNGHKLLAARADAPWDETTLSKHPALRNLDVSILHSVVLEHLLGISLAAQEAKTNLRYVKAFEPAFAPEEDFQASFLMNPTKIEEVIAVAESGEVMPQKSTFFYPKLPSGLVFYPFDERVG